jgi:hypothetical protein
MSLENIPTLASLPEGGSTFSLPRACTETETDTETDNMALPSVLSALGSLPVASLPSITAGTELQASLPTAVDLRTSSAIETLRPKSFSIDANGSGATMPPPDATAARLARMQAALAVQNKKIVRMKAAPKPSPTSGTERGVGSGLGPWTGEEVGVLRQLVAEHGEGNWDDKAMRMGSGRTAKALHTRWLRESGRIVDMPRRLVGEQGLLADVTTVEVNGQEKMLQEECGLLPMLSGSLAAAFGTDSL